MKYEKIKQGIFISRPNRFVARVMIDGEEQIVHVKNTGRCKEILIPGTVVFMEDHIDNMRDRKTRFSLVAAEKRNLGQESIRLINIDSQAPNKAVYESLKDGLLRLPGLLDLEDGTMLVKPEQTFQKSRFDFYLQNNGGMKAYIEVKGVTLENDAIARFPDAPTERGVKHVYELIEAVKQGFSAYIIFVIQMKDVKSFEPNDTTHAAFGQALRDAEKKGVNILAFDCNVTHDTMKIRQEVEINLR